MKTVHFIITLGAVCAAGFCANAGAADSLPPAPAPIESAQWMEALRQAGASPAEVEQFQEFLRLQSPVGLQATMERVRENPTQFFVRYLRGTRQQEGAQKTPTPVFRESRPVRACESLTGLSIAATEVDSATVDPADDACRVIASVTHPPATDRVRVFVALPLSRWNGRFRGTGGGGFWGGLK